MGACFKTSMADEAAVLISQKSGKPLLSGFNSVKKPTVRACLLNYLS
jgi:hypothetical protein